MEVEIGEYQKTLDEMSAAMANLNQEDYGSTIRIQELERRCEIASKQSGHLVSHHQHHMAEAWRKFEGEAQQMRKVEMNAFQYGEKKDMESNIIMQQMRQAEGTIMEQKREIALMKSYMASEKPAAQESAKRANQIHREASQQISVYQQQIRGIESSTSIEKFNEEEMVKSLKSQLEHALVKRPDYQIKADREDLMLDMKEKSVKSMMKSGGKDAAPATGKQENQGGKGRKGKPGGPDAAPVLPKAKAKGHAGKNGKTDGASDRGKSPGGSKDNPCWYHFKSAKGCVKGNECTFSHSKKTEHKLESMSKGKGKGKSKSRSSSPKRDDGACFAFQKGKCDKGSACKYRHELIKNNSAPATSSDKAQAKSKAAAKAAEPLQGGSSQCPR